MGAAMMGSSVSWKPDMDCLPYCSSFSNRGGHADRSRPQEVSGEPQVQEGGEASRECHDPGRTQECRLVPMVQQGCDHARSCHLADRVGGAEDGDGCGDCEVVTSCQS